MLRVKIGGLALKSPVIMMSGIFSYGEIDLKYLDYSQIGAVVTKTITLEPKEGNPQPRIWEAGSGMLNSIGLQNPGISAFVSRHLPGIMERGVTTIVSISGQDSGEVVRMIEILLREGVKAVEINLSCPNVHRDKPMVSQSAEMTYRLIKDSKSASGNMLLIAKLSPNVTDIAEIAVAAEQAGAGALSLINTVKGLCVDIEGRRIVEGGYSGPPIKPVGLKAVYEVFRKVKVPLIGIGGIEKGRDALEYILAGASAVGVGSGFFSNPGLPGEICSAVKDFILANKFKSIRYIAGLFNEKEENSSGKKKRN
ncbi:MAG TPA: dihydroorotate dehydrogenase [bacterium]|nr:dihydroorotate dehydrogenase [bacterium]